MKDLYKSIKTIAEHIGSAIVFFSCGKDSIVMLDLFQKYFKGETKIVFLYIHKGLKIREDILRYYENRYNIKIDQYPQFDTGAIFGKKLKQKDIEEYCRQKYNIDYLAYGYRRDESVNRSGILNVTNIGIDERNKKLYPLFHWTKRDVLNYVKQEKLPLPVDYDYGFRDVNIFKGEYLLWLYNNYRDDYEVIKQQYPKIEGELLKSRWQTDLKNSKLKQ